jgi:regulator of RNase E activity RraA
MDRLGVVHGKIAALCGSARCAGSALPVLTVAGDNLAIHAALEGAEPGDVLIVNGQGDVSRALFGGLLARKARSKGIRGVVIDGCVRDIAEIRELAVPTWARGVVAAGPLKHGPGVVGRPVACGGVVCAPGDIVVADASGVAIVPLADVVGVAERAEAIQVWEAEAVRRLEQ